LHEKGSGGSSDQNSGVRRLDTNYSTLVWSADGTQLTKSRPPGNDSRRRYLNEVRVNHLLNRCRPPVSTPRLLAIDRPARGLTFEALLGEPLGPKYPTDLTAAHIETMIGLAHAMRSYDPPRRRWMRRVHTERRLALATRLGALDPRAAETLITVARRHHRRLRFGHGDLTARNVLRHGDDVALIDWEWAGLYPTGYDEAFLWFSLQDLHGGRARVEQAASVDEPSFLLSALLVQLWHLQWYVPAEFRPAHLATRDELIGRLLG
jgi:hypothetical protein